MNLNKDHFNDFYKELDTKEVSRQGKAFLKGNAVQNVKTVKHRLWTLAWIVTLIVSCIIAGFYLWVLYEANRSGTRFSELRNESIKVLSKDPE